jgi:hypothetical protein
MYRDVKRPSKTATTVYISMSGRTLASRKTVAILADFRRDDEAVKKWKWI